jgi:thiol-disulfide isomerase/thioredoxin
MPVRKLSQSEFHHVLEQTPGKALVYFTTRSCGACRLLGGVLAELASQYPDVSVFAVDAGEEMGLVREFDVFHLPALFLYIHGQYHQVVHCEPTLNAIVGEMDRLQKLPAAEAP